MIAPNYLDEEFGIEMYQGDALEILPHLVDRYAGEVNCVLSDPPYGVAYVSNHRTNKDLLGQAIANDENLDLVELAVPYLDKLVADNSALYFFGHPNMIGENRLIFDKVWNYKNTLVWDKGDAGTFGDLVAGYSLNYESVFYYNKGRRKLNGSRPRTILRYRYDTDMARMKSEIEPDEYLATIEHLIYELPEDKKDLVISAISEDIVTHAMRAHPKSRIRVDWSSRNDPVHPTVKPVDLLILLLKYSTNEGDLVIDPFMGSGTCAAACKALGRRFIGIELRPEFFRVATNRVNKQTLFDIPKPVVQATMFE